MKYQRDEGFQHRIDAARALIKIWMQDEKDPAVVDTVTFDNEPSKKSSGPGVRVQIGNKQLVFKKVTVKAYGKLSPQNDKVHYRFLHETEAKPPIIQDPEAFLMRQLYGRDYNAILNLVNAVTSFVVRSLCNGYKKEVQAGLLKALEDGQSHRAVQNNAVKTLYGVLKLYAEYHPHHDARNAYAVALSNTLRLLRGEIEDQIDHTLRNDPQND